MANKKRRNYAELANILGWHYSDTSFCGLIAICVATHASPGKVKRYVEKFAKTWEGRLRQHRKGTPFAVIEAALNRFGKEHDADWDRWKHSWSHAESSPQGAGANLSKRYVSCICCRPCGLYPRGCARGLDCTEAKQAQGDAD